MTEGLGDQVRLLVVEVAPVRQRKLLAHPSAASAAATTATNTAAIIVARGYHRLKELAAVH